MKLEMRAWDLDVKLELQDDDAVDQLQVLEVVKNLLDTLSQFEKVNVVIKQIEETTEELDNNSDNVEAITHTTGY